MHGSFQGAEQTGGDTFELALTQRGLSTLQMHAMLRLARQLGATLATAFREVNDRLAATRRDSRFVAACVGLLDPTTRGLSMLSGGQVPILPLHAASGGCIAHRAPRDQLAGGRLSRGRRWGTRCGRAAQAQDVPAVGPFAVAPFIAHQADARGGQVVDQGMQRNAAQHAGQGLNPDRQRQAAGAASTMAVTWQMPGLQTGCP